MSNPLLKEIFIDIEPMHQDDGPNPICSINYTQEFVEAMGYLRAILSLDERSQRALDLTTICLRLNAANYTTWHFRRRCLAKLSSNEPNADKNSNSVILYDNEVVQSELAFASELGGGNPKNYQIWYHRRAMLEPLLSSSTQDKEKIISKSIEEIKYVGSVFEIDPKNYHAWSHRQWILRTANNDLLWDEELKYVHYLISDDDHRNNSAWNQRWFVSHRGNRIALSIDDAKVEADYAFNSSKIDPYNESPWRYFIGILSEQHKSITDETKKDIISLVKTYKDQVDKLFTSLTENGDDCYYQLLSAHVDLLELICDKDSLLTASDIARELATIHDTVRAKYWFVREKEILNNVAILFDNQKTHFL